MLCAERSVERVGVTRPAQPVQWRKRCFSWGSKCSQHSPLPGRQSTGAGVACAQWLEENRLIRGLGLPKPPVEGAVSGNSRKENSLSAVSAMGGEPGEWCPCHLQPILHFNIQGSPYMYSKNITRRGPSLLFTPEHQYFVAVSASPGGTGKMQIAGCF